MKRIIIVTTVGIWMITPLNTFADIKNGYEQQLALAEQSICNLNSLTPDSFAESLQKNLEKRRKKTIRQVNKLREYYRRTQVLIHVLRKAAPFLYREINTIKDSEGHQTNVYVRVVDDLGPDYAGMTNLRQSTSNPHVHTSEYGDYSVSVTVARSYITKELKTLVHELGHIRHQVPHLVSYVKYYRETYQNQYYKGENLGHEGTDPSHRSVLATLKAFRKSRRKVKRTDQALAKDMLKTSQMLVSKARKCEELGFTKASALNSRYD